MVKEQENNKRIAKNTLLLYCRLLLTMAVGLYTSRIVLKTLGVDDYGIYNVVAGFVTMFSLLTGSLSNAISRFLTYSLGKGNVEKLNVVFSTSVFIQICLAFFVVVIAEMVGLWFLYNHLEIPGARYSAAIWVFHLSVFSFAINLISVPYNAAIIAHEKMDAFAYISVIEVCLKLLIVFLLTKSTYDRLVVYAFLLALVSCFIRFVYGWYCKSNFSECRLSFVFDKNLVKDMTGFAGWNLLGTASSVLNNQGVNVIINIFFGVTVNAARGITNQIENIVKQFVTNFTTAINPQIVKSYAEENFTYMNTLICKGAKYSICLMLLFIVPLLFETESILLIWLGYYPEETAIFLRLALLGSIVDMSGNSLANAVWASGNVKKYYICIGSTGLLAIPATYILFKLGFPPYYSYVSYITVYVIIQIIRLFIAKSTIPFEIKPYVKEVYLKTILVAAISVCITAVPFIFISQNGFCKSVVVIMTAFGSTLFTVFFIGLNSNEKTFVKDKIKKKLRIGI